MFGLYLLVSLVTQISTGTVLAAIDPTPATLSVNFSSLNGVKVGSPVTVKGESVGTVIDVSQNQAQKEAEVLIQVDSKSREMAKNGAIALIASPLAAGSSKPQSVVELMFISGQYPQTKANHDAKIKGFSSYKEFWLAPDIKL